MLHKVCTKEILNFIKYLTRRNLISPVLIDGGNTQIFVTFTDVKYLEIKENLRVRQTVNLHAYSWLEHDLNTGLQS